MINKPITLLLLASLIGSAAPTVPSLSLESCTVLASGACDASAPFTFTGDGYSQHKDYLLVGAGDDIVVSVASDGSMTATGFSAPVGTWTFTMYQLNHNATPMKTLGSVDVTFQVAVTP